MGINKNPLISVIVPVYKVEKYLDECVQSIIHQTYNNLEIILVDDGSPDKCPEMCDEYAKQDSRIKVIHKKNGGLSSARNAGLENATGDYIGFVDSDDYIASNMYEELLKCLEQSHDLGVANCCYYEILIDNTICQVDKLSASYEIKDLELVKELLLCKLPPNVWSKLYKRDYINKVRFKEGYLAEDFLFSYYCYENLINSNKGVKYLNKSLYYYRRNPNGIMMSRKIEVFTHVIHHTEEILTHTCISSDEILCLLKSIYICDILELLGEVVMGEKKKSIHYNTYRNKILFIHKKELALWGTRHKLMFFILCFCPILWRLPLVRDFCQKHGKRPPLLNQI